MSKIKLIGHPYKDKEAGEICDFGDKINKSLVEHFGRAVWVEKPETGKVVDPKKIKTKKESVEVDPSEEELELEKENEDQAPGLE